MPFAKLMPDFFWKNAGNLREGTVAVQNGFEAVHFVGGEGVEHLGPEGCEELYLTWKDADQVLALRIGPNSLDETATGHLGQLLQNNDSIVYFCLYNNVLSPKAVKPISHVLSVNRSLVALQLVNCGLDFDAGKAIAHELEINNRSLLQIDLSHNNIQSEGAKAFSKMLKVNDILTTLSLSNNEIGAEGVIAIGESLVVNYTLCSCDLSENPGFESAGSRVDSLVERNVAELRSAVQYCNNHVKEGPLRKAKISLVGKNMSGKTSLIRALKGCQFNENYIPTNGVKVSQILTRLRGDAWYGVPSLPSGAFSFQFLSRFANVRLDQNVEMVEKKDNAGEKRIGFAALKKKRNRRGSVQQRRASVTGKRRASVGGANADDKHTTASRQSRRSSVAMSVLNAVLGEGGQSLGARGRRSVKGVLDRVAHPFMRKKNELLEDSDYVFYEENERAVGEAKELFAENELDDMFDVKLLAKARRERDNMGFNLMELSGNRAFYTIHHAFLTEDSVYVLVFRMDKLVEKTSRMDEIRYLNYWLKVIKYHSPDAKLLVAGTHLEAVGKSAIPDIESDISKLVFPELHKVHAERKQALKVNKAVQAANKFAKSLEEETDSKTEFVNKKINLIINEADRRLFFPLDLATGKGVDNLRLAIDSAAQSQPYYGQKIPISWLKFLDALRKDSPRYFCKAERVKALAFQNLSNHETEMPKALKLFHELGYIIHIKEIRELENTVITDTLGFYQSIFKIVITEDVCQFNVEEACSTHGLENAINEAKTKALLSAKLLNYLWGTDEEEEESKHRHDRKFLLEFLQLSLVISQYSFNGSQNKYIIPSLIPENTPLILETREKYGDGLGLRCRFSFKGSLTLGVFERLVCLCVQYASTQQQSLEPILAMGWGQFSFGMNYVFRLERLPDDIVLHIVESKKKPHKLVKSFEDMLFRIRQFLGKGFQWTVLLQDARGEKIPFSEAKKNKLAGWFS